MSKIKPDNISYNDDFVVIEAKNIDFSEEILNKKKEEINLKKEENEASKKAAEITDNALKKADEIIKNAEFEAKNILNKANEKSNLQSDEIIKNAEIKAQEILSSASEDAKNLQENTEKEAQEILNSSKLEIEKARAEAANEGYKDGYQDAGQKIQEELEEKIENFETFCKSQFEIKDKIIKSASKDIMDIVINIANKVLHKEIDANSLDRIIKSTILLFEKKEKINIILSEKYAKMLFELQKKSLNQDIEFDFQDFKQYEGFEIIYNPKFDDDTIILENPKERFDASINAQMDVIIRDIFENTSNRQLEALDEYIEEKNKNEA